MLSSVFLHSTARVTLVILLQTIISGANGKSVLGQSGLALGQYHISDLSQGHSLSDIGTVTTWPADMEDGWIPSVRFLGSLCVVFTSKISTNESCSELLVRT